MLVAEIGELPFLILAHGAQLPKANAYEWHAVARREMVVIAWEQWFLAMSC